MRQNNLCWAVLHSSCTLCPSVLPGPDRTFKLVNPLGTCRSLYLFVLWSRRLNPLGIRGTSKIHCTLKKCLSKRCLGLIWFSNCLPLSCLLVMCQSHVSRQWWHVWDMHTWWWQSRLVFREAQIHKYFASLIQHGFVRYKIILHVFKQSVVDTIPAY